MFNDQTIDYYVPLGALIDFLKNLYGKEDAIVSVELAGDGFIFYLGKDLPGAGEVSSISINLPSGLNIDMMRPLLKERLDLD